MRGYSLLYRLKRDQSKCPLYGIVRCPLLRGFEYIDVYGNIIRTFRIVCYIAGVRRWGVSVKQGSTVHLYTSCATWCLVVQMLICCSTVHKSFYVCILMNIIQFLYWWSTVLGHWPDVLGGALSRCWWCITRAASACSLPTFLVGKANLLFWLCQSLELPGHPQDGGAVEECSSCLSVCGVGTCSSRSSVQEDWNTCGE